MNIQIVNISRTLPPGSEIQQSMNESNYKKLIIGNWKMYTSAAEARRLAQAIVEGLSADDRVPVVVCPPFPYLALVGEILRDSGVALGAQNLYPENEGAFTGEVSPTMLLDLGCEYVIVGHSERRQKLGETDTFINQKVKVALAAGLAVVLCIGETLEQRNAKQTEAVLDRQLAQGLPSVSSGSLNRLSIGYEPIWAIGERADHATAQQVQDAHAIIRRCFAKIFDEKSANDLSISYGGSVNPENAGSLLSRDGVDGALVGSDSLDADQFLAIIRAGMSVSQVTEEHGK